MSKVVSIFALKQRECEIKQWQDWVVGQIYWHMMIDRSFDEADIVNALGYPECEHQLYAYMEWVKQNQSLFERNHTPIEILNIAVKELTECCDRYFQGCSWRSPNQFER